MSTLCPNCGSADPGSGKFCIHCGQPLPESIATEPQEYFAPSYHEDVVPSDMTYEPTANVPPPPKLPPQPAMPSRPMLTGGGSGVSAASVWGPFAGRGIRGRHVAWLLDNLGEKAEDLRNAVTKRFQDRHISGALVQSQILVAKGLMVEQRPYYLIQRGRTTIGLYIAQFGKDLYISQVSYFKGPISVARIVTVALMAVFALFYPLMLADSADNLNAGLGGMSGVGDLVGKLCCLGPVYAGVWMALLVMILFALYKFVVDKDILAPLRVQPNEFDQDDLIALEKAVEQTVRESLDVVGIEQELMPPAEEYGLRQRLI